MEMEVSFCFLFYPQSIVYVVLNADIVEGIKQFLKCAIDRQCTAVLVLILDKTSSWCSAHHCNL